MRTTRFVKSGAVSSHARVGVAALLVTVAAGCASGGNGPAGVQPTPLPTGPTVLATPTIPPLVARAPVSSHASPVTASSAQRLSKSIDAALTQPGRLTPAARVSQKVRIDSQVLVHWTVGSTAPDPGARQRLRTDAIKILAMVKAAKLRYGSVLLLASGPVVIKGRKTVAVVVRAKYSKRLVSTTDWTKVSPAMILRMPDHKGADIAPGYR